MASIRSLVIPTIIIGLFSACSGKNSPNEEALRYLNGSLEVSRQTISKSTQTFLYSLEEKLQDPTTSAKALIWFPRAKMVEKLTKGILVDIDSVKNKLNADQDKSKPLHKIENIHGEIAKLREKLVAYNRGLQTIDSQMTRDFPNPVKIGEVDSSDALSLPIYLFSRKINIQVAISLLNQFENIIKNVENRMIQYANYRVAYAPPNYESYGAIIAINAMRVEPGANLEITAGIGAFSKTVLPKISIDGEAISISEDGATHYTFSAPKESGKYKKHVKIEYMDYEGRINTIQRDVFYSVVQ